MMIKQRSNILLIAIGLFAFLAPSNVLAQDVNSVLKKLREKYLNTSKIEYSTTYELFKGHKSNEVHTSYSGYVYRENKAMYQKIDVAEFVYGQDFSLKVNSEEKVMVLGKKNNTLDLEVDLDEITKLCKSKTLKEFDDYYSITFTFKEEVDIPVSVIKMRVAKSTYDLQQLDMYYSDFLDFSIDPHKTDMQPSHLRITFTNIDHNPEKKDYLFQLNRYLETKDNMHTPTSRYKGFALIDERV